MCVCACEATGPPSSSAVHYFGFDFVYTGWTRLFKLAITLPGVDQRLKDPDLPGQVFELPGSLRNTVLKDKVWSNWGRHPRLSSGFHTCAQMLMWTCLHLYMQTKAHTHQDTDYIQWNVCICSNQIGKFWWVCIFMWPSKIITYLLVWSIHLPMWINTHYILRKLIFSVCVCIYVCVHEWVP